MDQLTDRQREVFDYISRQVRRGPAPTLREIGKNFGMSSTNAVADHLVALEKKGYIVRDPLKSRHITVRDAWDRSGVVHRAVVIQAIRQAGREDEQLREAAAAAIARLEDRLP